MTMAKMYLGIKGHQEELSVFITKLGYYPIVLELPWLQLYDVTVKLQRKRIGFESRYCQQHCQHHASILVCGDHIETLGTEKKNFNICAIAAAPFMRGIKKHKLKVSAVTRYEINKVLQQ